jgi:hypothetical protein
VVTVQVPHRFILKKYFSEIRNDGIITPDFEGRNFLIVQGGGLSNTVVLRLTTT